MKIILIFVLIIMVIASCVPGANELTKTSNDDGKTAGFLKGVWHGFTSFFTFIVSLFNKNVNVYEVHNNGGWYNLGFIFGIMSFYGGSGSAGKKGYRKYKD